MLQSAATLFQQCMDVSPFFTGSKSHKSWRKLTVSDPCLTKKHAHAAFKALNEDTDRYTVIHGKLNTSADTY